MAASEAIIGYDTGFDVEATAGVGDFAPIGEVTGVTPPNESVDDIEVTHMKSPDRAKEYIPGLTDYGDMSVDLNYIPGQDTDEFIAAWRASGETRSCRITYPNGATRIFPAYVKGFAPTGAMNEKMGATLTLKVAGAVVRG